MITQNNFHNLTFTQFDSPVLPDFIREIVEVQGHDMETSVRLYPRNTPEVLINLGRPIKGKMGDKSVVIEESMIQGSKTHFVNVWHPKYCHFISIRFTTNGFIKFLGKPQQEFTDRYFNLDDVITSKTQHLSEALRHASSVRERFGFICYWLRANYQLAEKPQQLLSDFIIHEIRQKPDLSVQQLTAKTGYTRKHLAATFKQEAGLTIKQYQKINRINAILKDIDREGPNLWPKLIFEYGFYDQSHFIRNFKQYTGFTPSDYLRKQSRNSLAS